MEFSTAFTMAVNGVNREVLSARPDAPVVPHVPPRDRTRAVRLVLSSVLLRASHAIAPVECGPAR
jgi:hypothetical protein